MFRKVNVPILGIIENMSYFICANCGSRHEIFAHGGVEKACKKLDTELLGEIPLDSEIRAGGDEGTPIVAKTENSPNAVAFSEIARKVKNKLTS
jgi:ATP-binding protein involved in chromosome partitioning